MTSPDHKVRDENIELFANNLKTVLKEAVESSGKWREPTLRMSNIGTPDLKLWFDLQEMDESERATRSIDPTLQIKFLYGHMLEELVLFLVRESGHLVEGEQDEVDIGGVKGHRDCKIDGVVVDVKSTSKFAFKKFSTGSLFSDDPFGYVAQLSGYVQGDKDSADYGAFLAINKETGELALLEVDPMDMINAEERIEHIKKVISSPTPPKEKCYEDKPVGKSGNRAVHTNCSFCPHMHRCWEDANGGHGIRTFQYSHKKEHLTHVASEPRVPEVM